MAATKVVLFFGATTVLGLLWSYQLRGIAKLSERFGVGMALGLLLQVWLPFAISKTFGLKLDEGSLVALGICVVAAALLIELGRWQEKTPSLRTFVRTGIHLLSKREALEVLLFFVLLGALLGWLFYTHSLAPSANGLTSAGVSWEDQSGHAMYASSFLFSDNLTAMENPQVSGWPLAYPFLSDFMAAALTSFGVTLSQAFWLSGWYAVMTFIILVWSSANDWLGSPRKASLVCVILLSGAGFGFLEFIEGVYGGSSWQEVLMRHDYANAWELKLHYHNVLIAILLPMRSFLFGLSPAVAALFLLRRSMERGLALSRRELLTAGILTGLTPLINAHACIVIAWCGGILILQFLRPAEWKGWISFALFFLSPALLIALPQLLWTHRQIEGSTSFIRFYAGWMADAHNLKEWLQYWLYNGGVRLPFGLLCWLFAPRRLKFITLPFLSLLILGNFVVFQPLVYDNIKFFLFADVALAALIVMAISIAWERSRRFIYVIVPLIVLITASGILSIWREMKIQWVVVDSEGVRFAELAREKSAPRAIFLTSSELTHPIPVLTGRPLVLGYKGWVGNLGIPWDERSNDVREMFENGAQAGQLFEKYHIKFVVVGPPERREFPKLNEENIAKRAVNHWERGHYTLYEL